MPAQYQLRVGGVQAPASSTHAGRATPVQAGGTVALPPYLSAMNQFRLQQQFEQQQQQQQTVLDNSLAQFRRNQIQAQAQWQQLRVQETQRQQQMNAQQRQQRQQARPDHAPGQASPPTLAQLTHPQVSRQTLAVQAIARARIPQPYPHQHGGLPALGQADLPPPGTRPLHIGATPLEHAEHDARVYQWLDQTLFTAPTQYAPPSYRLPAVGDHWSNTIHVAHLNEPVITTPNADMAMYAWINKLMLAPLHIYTKFDNAEAKLYVEPQVYANLARSIETPAFTRERPVVDGSYTLRIRCMKIQPHWKITKSKKITVAEYLALEPGLEWPDHLLAMAMNRKKTGAINDNGPDYNVLEWRRKIPHQKSMPIDITEKVVGGTNVCDIVCNSQYQGKAEYIMGFEAVLYGNEARVRSLIQEEAMESTPARIAASLAGNDDDSDELQIVSTHLSIHVRDPLAGTLVRNPVRSALCKHLECFDLEAFMSSRSMDKPEGWKCPICSVDARPKNLRLDPWLKQVIAKCAQDVDAIEVDADGKWKVQEDKNKKKDNEKKRGRSVEAKPVPEAATQAPKKPVEIVDLDSD